MANESLAFSARSINLVSRLAHLIDTALQERFDFSGHRHVEYFQTLATLAGLGFTAVLAEGSQVRSCRPHFAVFQRYRDFTQHSDKLKLLSRAIAEIVCHAIYPFRMLGHPGYFDEFISALMNALQSSDTQAGTDARIKIMIQELFKQYS